MFAIAENTAIDGLHKRMCLPHMMKRKRNASAEMRGIRKMYKLPIKCEPCIRRQSLRCDVFEDVEKAQARTGGCGAYMDDPAQLKELQRQQRNYANGKT
jgi:transcription elongation factor Elf1